MAFFVNPQGWVLIVLLVEFVINEHPFDKKKEE
jgi:hypothetical protein